MEEKIPNSENNKEFVTQAELLDTEESTIFADPNKHTDKKPVKNSAAKKITAVVLAVVILAAGAFAVVKWLPEKELENVLTFAQGELFSYEAKSVTGFSLENANGTLNIKGEIIKESLENDQAYSRHFTLEGYDETLIDHDSLAQLVDSAMTFKYFTSYAAEDLAPYGLVEPEINVKVTGEGFDYTIGFGAPTSDSERCYAITSQSPGNVFVVATSTKELFSVSAYDLAITTAIAGIEKTEANEEYFYEDSLESFDSLVVSGKKIASPITIIPNTNEKFSSMATFITTTPKARIANDAESIRDIFADGLISASTVSFDQSAESLKKFGLDNPDYMLTLKLGGETHTYRFTQSKETEFEYYTASSTDRMIRTVSVANIPFVDREEKDYYILFTVLESITDLNGLEVSGEANAHFNIDYDEDKEEYLIDIDGKKVTEATFKSAYQDFIGTNAIDINTVKTSAKPSLTVKLFHKDGSEPTVLTFTKVSETRYQYTVGGEPMGQITSNGYNTILKGFKNAIG